MQLDYSLTDRIEFSAWCDWRQLGLGVSAILRDIRVFRLELLFFGVVLTVWPR